MLTEDEKTRIQAAVESSTRKREAALEALMIVQESRGWISDEITEVARILEMTPVELESIATFYSRIYRRPVGRHVITICDSASCWIKGSHDLMRHLLTSLGVGLGETTGDGRFTVLPSACLGLCEQAPAMMVGKRVYGNLTAERLDEILREYS